MSDKRDIQTITSEQVNHLDRILDEKDVQQFKQLIPELKDTWHKKQLFRTETEMRFSVLNDIKHPTSASKYWQSVREQNSHFENLMRLSFEARKNDIEIKKIRLKLKKEDDFLEKELLKVELDEKNYHKASLELTAKHRIREIEHWSRIKKELTVKDKTMDTKDVNTHQLDSYAKRFKHSLHSLTPGTSYSEKINVISQAATLERINKEEREKLEHKKKEQISNGKL